MTDGADEEEGGRGGSARRSSDGGLVAVGEGAGGLSSSPRPTGGAGEGVDLVSSLLYGGVASLLLRQGHELGMGHEAVDGATGLWALQPLVQGATERVHHFNLQETEKERRSVRGRARHIPAHAARADGTHGGHESGCEPGRAKKPQNTTQNNPQNVKGKEAGHHDVGGG